MDRLKPIWKRLPLRGIVVALLAGTALTFLVAWSCALWSPVRSSFDPFEDRAHAVETPDADDGSMGLFYVARATGWEYTHHRGQKFISHGDVDFWWDSPYGGTYHQHEGWPFKALRSRAIAVNSSSQSYVEGQDEPEPMVIQHHWQLPWSEILHRGLNSSDLPARFHAQPDRRLALIPMPAGFLADMVLYATLSWLLARGTATLFRKIRAQPRGFPVIMNEPNAPTPN